MDLDQIKLLGNLAKKIGAEKRDRSKVIASLQSAKILNKQEGLTGTYSNLNRVVSPSK